MNTADWTPDDLQGQTWDVVVIGTGAGGATAGFNLARLGRSVLFLERGALLHRQATASSEPDVPASAEGVAGGGWWPDPVYERTNGVDVCRRIPLGCGTGGSTALFAGVMDRFRPVDLTPRRFARTSAGP